MAGFDFAGQLARDQALLAARAAGLPIPAGNPFPTAPRPLPQSAGGFRQRFVSGGNGGGSVVGAVVGALPVVGGLIGALLGGGNSTPSEIDQVIQTFRQFFPDQNAPIADTPIDISALNGGNPLWLNIPSSDPNFGTVTRSTIEWWIKAYGLAPFFRALAGFMSNSPTGQNTSGETGGEGPITVNVTNAETIGADVANTVSSAVSSAIAQAAANSDQVAQQTTAAITNQISTFSNGLFDWVKSVGSWIKDNIGSLVESLASHLKDILGTVLNTIKDAIVSIADKLGPILESVGTKIAEAINTFQQFYQDRIAPIVNLIEATIRTVQTVQADVEAAVKGGLKGILQLPTELTDAISGWQGALERTKAELSRKATEITSNIAYDSELAGQKNHFAKMADALSGLTSSKTDLTTFKVKDRLADTCNLSQVTLATGDFMQGLADSPDWLKWAVKALLTLPVSLAEVAGELEIINDLSKEDANKHCAIKKLDGATLAEAWKRGFISDSAMDEELAAQGYNGGRSKVLRDLTRYVENQQDLLEYLYRGIITDGDFAAGLGDLGYSDQQIDAARRASVRLLDPGVGQEALRRGIIDEATYTEILRVQRFDNAQQQLLTMLVFRPAVRSEVYPATIAEQLVGQLTTTSLQQTPVPGWYSQAGRAEGLSDDAITDAWNATYWTPDIATIIQEYFRGLRTLNDVHSVMDAHHILPEFRDEIIEVNRALIPFRTIPSMIAAGILSPTDGKAELMKHGYDSLNAQRLIDYSTRATKSTKAATAKTQHDTSLALAKQLFDDGAITEQDWRAVLKEHGLSQDSIDAEVKLATVANAVKARKDAAQAIVDEYAAGLIDYDAALLQFAQQNFTLAEQAKYAKQLRKAKTQTTKLPGEAELNRMMQKSIISQDDYLAALEGQGYASKWANAFLALRIGGDMTGTAPAVP